MLGVNKIRIFIIVLNFVQGKEVHFLPSKKEIIFLEKLFLTILL